jgi:hypothetical protein
MLIFHENYFTVVTARPVGGTGGECCAMVKKNCKSPSVEEFALSSGQSVQLEPPLLETCAHPSEKNVGESKL